MKKVVFLLLFLISLCSYGQGVLTIPLGADSTSAIGNSSHSYNILYLKPSSITSGDAFGVLVKDYTSGYVGTIPASVLASTDTWQNVMSRGSSSTIAPSITLATGGISIGATTPGSSSFAGIVLSNDAGNSAAVFGLGTSAYSIGGGVIRPNYAYIDCQKGIGLVSNTGSIRFGFNNGATEWGRWDSANGYFFPEQGVMLNGFTTGTPGTDSMLVYNASDKTVRKISALSYIENGTIQQTSSNFNISGSGTMTGLNVNGTSTLQNIMSLTDLTYNIGNASTRYTTVFTPNINAGSGTSETITAGNRFTMTTAGGGFVMNGISGAVPSTYNLLVHNTQSNDSSLREIPISSLGIQSFSSGQGLVMTSASGLVTYSQRLLDTTISIATTTNASASSSTVYASITNLQPSKTYSVTTFLRVSVSAALTGGIAFSSSGIGASNAATAMTYFGNTASTILYGSSTVTSDGTGSTGLFSPLAASLSGFVRVDGTFTTAASGETQQQFAFTSNNAGVTATITGPGSYIIVRQVN